MAQVFKGAGTEAARVAGNDPEMDRVADRMADLIRATAAPHRDTGAFGESVEVHNVRGKRGVRDRLVTVSDPDAEHIEYGHATTGPDGEGAWVPGLHIVGRAYQAMR